jgi:aryl-alcohol dehydrogenase-like predicted oxidoreductase
VDEQFARSVEWNVECGSDARESQAIFEAFANAGGNFIDTADVYGDGCGASERLVGEFIRADRDRFVVSTKYTLSFGKDPSKSGNSRKNMRRCVEDSLRRLGTDHIDLYWLHAWDFSTPMDEILRGLDDLVSSGKVTYIAATNVEAWRLSSANTFTDLRGWAPFIGIQVCYSLAERTAERDLLPMAKALDLGITASAPLAAGILTAKHGNASTSGDGGRWAGREIPENFLAVARLVAEVARDVGCTPGQVALAWLRQQKGFANAIIPILGARKASQLKENIGCLDVVLSEDQFRRLDEATAIDMGHLHRVLTARGHGARDFAYAGHFDSVDNHRA